MFAKVRITAVRDGDDTLLSSADELGSYPVTVLQYLRDWATADPGHPLVAERDAGGSWQTVSYGGALAAADALGQALLDRGLGPARPLLILSGNGVNHLLLTLGALTAGIPVAPVSVAYSLQSKDHARIRSIAELITPGAVFAEEAEAFGPALDAVTGATGDCLPIAGTGTRPGAAPLGELLATAPGDAVHGAYGTLTPDTVAKILFTSGSTGTPKGVLNTHRMLASNQQMIRQGWPFLADERPVLVDWLPWSHTFGGNHNVNMMLANGGTIYVDGGRPAPGQFERTLANLADVPPTVYFNVPAGYARLVPALEGDPEFAARFFSRLRLLFNAAAALPGGLRGRLEELAERHAPGRAVPVTAAWGATETAPAVTMANFPFSDARCIGAPLPGVTVKLVPNGDACEIRVLGPNVTPGYYARPDLTADAFDADGFYRSGDAVAFTDPGNPDAGLVFRGRLAEDFKLSTGTFVRVGAARAALLSAVPVLSDAVLAGENRDYLSALVWVNPAEARTLLGRDPAAADGDLVTDPELLGLVEEAVAKRNAGLGSAARVDRLVILARPASLDTGEVTDKGYVNQRRVLAERAALVELLYTDPVPDGVVVPGR